MLHSPERLSMDEISSPISPHIFEFCDPQLFQVASSSNCCYEENSYASKLDLDNSRSTASATSSTTNTTNNNSNLSVIFDSTQDQLDNDISASINFSPSQSFPFLTAQQDQIDYASLQPQIPVTDPLLGPPLTSVFDEDCLSYLPVNPASCSFLCSPFPLSADTSAMGMLMQHQELELDFQALGGNESQQLVSGGASSAPLASKMEESTFKVGKLSVEQRKEKIHRYMKKRNERNFSKKIKYACRKTLADSRPRVRGRFAKNDDFGETYRPACSNHEDDDDEEVVVVKEEDEMVESSDIFAHISGVNSFKCNYPIQSWI